MMKYKKPVWAINQTTRESGLIEDICMHGIGHPNDEWLRKNDRQGKLGFSIHGCDGCCSSEMKKAIEKRKE